MTDTDPLASGHGTLDVLEGLLAIQDNAASPTAITPTTAGRVQPRAMVQPASTSLPSAATLSAPVVASRDASGRSAIGQTLSPFDASLIAGPDEVTPTTHSLEDERSHGTLVITKSGQSKYLGRTAASEWLKNEVADPADNTPPVSSYPSPKIRPQQLPADPLNFSQLSDISFAFPFSAISKPISMTVLLAQLPERADGQLLVDLYYRHFAWHFNVVARDTVMKRFDTAYSAQPRPDLRPEHLALLCAVFAAGSYYNFELPADDPSTSQYLELSKACLVKADFMANNTLAVLQTLHIMGHLLLLDSGKNGDKAWPLWGLSTRLVQAMGLHRDGERWDLPMDVVEERRRVFWEIHSTDCMTSNCFSRAGPMSAAYIDTAYPSLSADITPFQLARFRLSRIFALILDQAMRVEEPPYSDLQVLHNQLIDFERNIEYSLRCRPVLCALSSLYLNADDAVAASPPVDARALARTFQVGARLMG